MTRWTGTLHKSNIHCWYLPKFFLDWEMVHTKVVEKKKHILFSITSSQISCHLWDNLKTFLRAGQATDGNMAHANCILDKHDYKHTLRIWTTHCFSRATMVAQMPLNVTFLCRMPILLLTPPQRIVFFNKKD
jgi:hypothetical protein